MKCYFELAWNRVPESHDDVQMRTPTYEWEGETVAVYASALPLCACCCKIISEDAKYARSQPQELNAMTDQQEKASK